MNRMVVFLVAMWFISGTAFAQEEKKNTETTVSDKISWGVSSHVDGQKFEILARPHDSRLTYRINKETGEVWLLDGASSSLLDAENLDNAMIVPDKNNFQLILVSSKTVYLMHLQTGEVWYLKFPGLFNFHEARFVKVKMR